MIQSCDICGPDEVCSKCLQPYPHSQAECDEQNDLVQLHTIEAFGVTIPVRVELRPIGRRRISDLEGPPVWTVEVRVNGAGSFFETEDPGSERALRETEEQHTAEREYRERERAEGRSGKKIAAKKDSA